MPNLVEIRALSLLYITCKFQPYWSFWLGCAGVTFAEVYYIPQISDSAICCEMHKMLNDGDIFTDDRLCRLTIIDLQVLWERNILRTRRRRS